MKPAIKTWNYPHYAHTAGLELYEDRIVDVFHHKTFEYSYEEVLSQNFIRHNLQTTAELLLEMRPFLKGKTFSPKAELHSHFWDFYQPVQANPIEFGIQCKLDYFNSTLLLDHSGICEKSVYEEDKVYYQNLLRIDHLYFYGPLRHSLDLNIRKQIKAYIYQHFKTNSPFHADLDGFLFFDYSKLVNKTWEFGSYESGYYSFLSLGKGYVLVGGRDGMDGGQSYLSCEQVYYFPDMHIPSALSHCKSELMELLKKAIINVKAEEAPPA